ncbi:MAG: tetratricopeptide repeat protein [Chloroflexota bacterium]
MTDFKPLEAPAKDIQDLPLMHPGRPVGRDAVLKEIYTHLQSQRPVLLHGASGNGKTALAAALAAAFVQQAGGVVWLNVRTHPLSALLAQIGRALDIEDVKASDQPAAHVGAVSTALTQQKPFIVLDNVEDALAPQQFIDKAADNIPLVMISETELEGPWETVHVDVLSDTDSLVLFKQKSGIQGSDSDIDIYGLTKLLDYRPLPLVLAARGMVAAKQAPTDYLKNLKAVNEQSGDVTLSAIALSYRSLNNALQGLILMLGATFRGEASLDFLAQVSGVPASGIQQAMNILAQLYLVEKFTRYGKDYYRMPTKVHAFARSALQGKNQLGTLQQKVHDTTLEYALDHIDDPKFLAKELSNFIATAQWASDNGDRDTASQLADTLTEADDFIDEHGYTYEALVLRNIAGGNQAFPAYADIEPVVDDEPDDGYYDYDDDEEYDDDESFSDLYEQFTDTAAMQAAPGIDVFDDDFDDFDDEYELDESILDDEDESTFEAPDLGDLNIIEGMDSQALRTDQLSGIDVDQLRQALAQAKQQNDVPRITQIYKAIGKVQVGQDKDTEAITTYNELLEVYEAESDTEGVLDTLNMLGSLLIKTGNSQAAVMHATQGVQAAKDANDSATELQMHMILGEARQDLGETQSAVDSFKKSLEIARNTGDRQHEALILYNLGNAHLDNGSTDDAIHSLEQARELFKDQVKRDYEGRVLGALGSANADLEQWSEAIGYYRSALYIAREVDDKEDESLQLSNLAQAQEQSGKVGEALQSYRQALHLAFESENRAEIVSAIVDLVRLLLISPVHLDIADMLLKDAMNRDPEDKDVLNLFQQVSVKRQEAMGAGKTQKPVNGTAQQYAANAYELI